MMFRFAVRALFLVLVVAGLAGCEYLPVLDCTGLYSYVGIQMLYLLGIETTITYDYSDSVPFGTVIRQDPPPEQIFMPVGTCVHLVVSRGPAPVTVPDLSGYWSWQAEGTLADAGLLVEDITPRYCSWYYYDEGGVCDQYPAPGTQVTKGMAVRLFTAKYPESRPIEIESIEELQQIGNDPAYPLDGHYVLKGDIDASATATWNDGAGFVPIGSIESPFAGLLYGYGHTIRGLTIDRPDDEDVGLFAAVGESGAVESVYLSDGIITGDFRVGAFAALNSGSLTDCTSNCAVSARREYSRAGGIVGDNHGRLRWCTAQGAVAGGPEQDSSLYGLSGTGGVAGVSYGLLKKCDATGSVSGESYVGGLVGYCIGGSISDCSAGGSVSAGDEAGGLVGSLTCNPVDEIYVMGAVRGSHATGSVTGESELGGLVGAIENNQLTTCIVESCYATGNVTCLGGGDEDSETPGGLIGESWGGLVRSCSAWGDVKGGGAVGSLVGSQSEGTIEECCAMGLATSFSGLGALVASNNQGIIRNCFAVGPASGKYEVTGLVRWNKGVVDSCFATGTGADIWNGDEWRPVGCGSAIRNCFWNTTGSESSVIGGTGISREDFLKKSTFLKSGWNFYDTWTQEDGLTIPRLRHCSMPPGYPSQPGISVTSLGSGSVEIRGNERQQWGLVTLVPVAAPGYRFAGWMGDGLPEDTPVLPHALSVVGIKERRLQAVFLEDNPIPIETIEELQKIGSGPDYPLSWHYTLAKNIDASVTAAWNEGKGFDPIGAPYFHFSGILDGKGHSISGLTINRPDEDSVGLFRVLDSGGVIENTKLVEGAFSGKQSVGSLVGYARQSVLRSCDVSCTVSGHYIVGGIAGLLVDGTIELCSSSGSVAASSSQCGGLVGYGGGTVSRCYSDCTVSGYAYIGGLVGFNSEIVHDCYALGAVSGRTEVGGLVGENYGTITDCYSAGAVSAVPLGDGTTDTTTIGGLVGSSNSSMVVRSFWDIETSGQTASAGGSGRFTSRMMKQATYEGWDFESVWDIDEGRSYPWLRELE